MFLIYLQHFVKIAKPTEASPILLLLDNHASHVTLKAVNFCRNNNIKMLGLPPHTTQRLQPLDVGFFGPLKTFYSQACDNFMVSNSGRAITETKVGHLFEKAYSKAATVGNATKGLKACGIEPFNDNIFSEEDFAASKVSERPIEEVKDEVQAGPSSSQPSPSSSQPGSSSSQPGPSSSQPGPSSSQPGPSSSQPGSSSSQPEPRIDAMGEVENGVLVLPVATRVATKRKRATLLSMVITSTPVKQHLERKENEKNVKEEKKAKRETKVKESLDFGKTGKKVNTGTQDENKICPGCNEKMKTHQKRYGFSVMNVRSGGIKTVPTTKLQDTFHATTVNIRIYAILPHLEGKMTNLRS